jgi:hypothetical protein
MMVSLSTNTRVRPPLAAKMRALQLADAGEQQHRNKNDLYLTTGGSGGKQLPRVGDVFLHNARLWKKGKLTGGLGSAGEALRPELYQQVLLDSVFTLSPSGHNPETFRLYEAAEAGSIPIVDNATSNSNSYAMLRNQPAAATEGDAAEYEYSAMACGDPWRPFLATGAPFVWVQSWEDIEGVLEGLRAEGPAALERRQARLREWYFKFMRAGAMAVESTLRAHEANHERRLGVGEVHSG